MAIIKGAINFGSNFNIGAKGPIDARQRVETIADLTTAWTEDIPAYKDMVVAVEEDHNLYILTADDATVSDNWKLIGDVSGDITNLQGQIDVINGTGDGSFKKGDADTLAAAKADATTKADAVKGSDTDDAGAATVYGANKAAAAAQKTIDDFKGRTEGFATAAQGTKAEDADTLSKANKAEIDIINGTGDGSFKKAVSDAKTELIGNDATADTIKHAEKLATDASKKVDTAIAGLDGGGTSPAVKGVTVTVNETDGIIAPPSVSIADGTLTGAATDANLVTGTVVKKYVDDKVSDINTAAGTLSGRVDTLEGKVGSKAVEGGAAATGLFKEIADEASTARAAEKKNADAIAAETTRATAAEKKNADAITAETNRATAAEEQVKTDLLGSATDDYNTLGKLETKIKDAKTAADNAQATADAKVKSVEGTNTVIATTTDHAVSVSLKTSDKGNVKFTQDTDGLSANVTIPPATVTGVKSGDKVLALDGTELTSTISLSVDTSADGDGKKYIRLRGIGGADLGKIDIADFVKDGMLDSASLVTNPAGQSAGTYIKLTWNTDGGKAPMYINVTSLIDIYTNGDGLTLTDHEFSVDWVKVAKKSDLDTVTGKVSTLEGKVGSAAAGEEAATGLFKDIADNKAAIADEADRAMQAEAALLGTDGDDATKDTIKGAKKAVEDLKSQIAKDAVTLTIPDDDPYITASKDATTNKYTIKSKLDADGTTPLVDVKINAKLTEKINSLDGGGTSAANGISVTVTETDGIVAPPTVTVTPGSVADGNTSVVTGDAVYTAVEAAKTALIGTDADTKDSNTIKGAKKYTDDALVWHDIA